MKKRKRASWLCAAVASLGSMLSLGCFSGRRVSHENVRAGYLLMGFGAFSLACAPIQEDPGGEVLLYGLGGVSLVMGGSLLWLEAGISRNDHKGLLDEEELARQLSYIRLDDRLADYFGPTEF